ncbi:Cyclic AMP-dependent transcription factor ATF-3 [Fukomys damarensis]|uniref:Cyclic AMP-dependent transcription factor ATF-3 n=1 Tax=Fukomys damarensis TaxID=885580 RepID=A0A091D589_FUKDA|nr:Cyclic AMP-dependent transcription factor ATF-3 [Fukomys damarensis]
MRVIGTNLEEGRAGVSLSGDRRRRGLLVQSGAHFSRLPVALLLAFLLAGLRAGGRSAHPDRGTLVFEDFANLTPFVKEELRFAIQSKHLCHRMSAALESVTVSDRPLEMSVMKAEAVPEEDERKKRRRERNKIAAAKCRNKKKEKTECLQKESEKLESVNAELKAQIEELKNEKQHLIYMLNLHRPTCIVRAQNGRTPEDERNLFIQQIKEGTLQS